MWLSVKVLILIHEGINTNYWKIPILQAKNAKNTSHLTFSQLVYDIQMFSRVRCHFNTSPLLTLTTMERPSRRWGVVRSALNTSPLHCIDIQYFKCKRWGVRCFCKNSSEDFLGENLKIDFTLHACRKSAYFISCF